MLRIAHANQRGTGAGLLVDVDTDLESNEPCIAMTMLDQVGDRISEEDPWTVRLNAFQAMHIVNLARGLEDRICNGKGMFANGDDGLQFRIYGEVVEEDARVVRIDFRGFDGNVDLGRRRIQLNPNEADTIGAAILSSIGTLAFGL